MKIKTGFTLRDICGEKIIVPEGMENINFNDLICPNETSAYLWERVQGKEFTAADLAHLLTEAYEVDDATALADSEEIMQDWLRAGIAE